MRCRGSVLLETLGALALAVLLTGALVAQIGSQSQLLRSAHESARAREALLAGYERVRAGAVAPPPVGSVRTLETAGGVTVTVERAKGPVDPRLEAGGALVPVVVRASWRSADGKPRERELATLVPGGGP